MPQRLKQRQAKIQAKRKQTPWREFVMEICSRRPIMLYKNNWLISRYPKERINKVTTDNEYIRQKKEYSGDFFSDFQSLFFSQELLATTSFYSNENAKYSDGSWGWKNFYLCFDAWWWSQDVVYSHVIFDNSSDVLWSNLVWWSEWVYESSWVYSSHMVFNSYMIRNSAYVRWSSNLIWCSYCIECHGLENKKYHVKNIEVTPQEFDEYLNSKQIFRHSGVSKVDTCRMCTNVEQAEYVNNISTGRNLIFAIGWDWAENIFDGMNCGLSSTHMYGISATGDCSSHVYCVAEWGNLSHCFYCYHIESCSYCLWCIWLKNKSYCIFNKQYTKEERYDKVDEIFSQMEKDGTLGNFFPWSMNPFYFNDTAAYLLDDSFTKEEVEAAWYLWRDEAIQVDIPKWVEVVKVSELGEYEWWSTTDWSSWDRREANACGADVHQDDDKKWTINPEILKKVIQDEQWNVYRIVKMEYNFLMKHELPLPRKHRLDRIKQHFIIA